MKAFLKGFQNGFEKGFEKDFKNGFESAPADEKNIGGKIFERNFFKRKNFLKNV